ncbi:MAG TPA: ATP synthase F1 subunit gamma [Solirubrobacteraceae bacterium]|nr:ATP synthase F1 subunit gamma [Solirubrobacteraceae bacterium]
MASQRDVKNRIGSVKNIQKITRAMEMVAAARLRRAEQRIEVLRPYADALRRMTRQAARDAGPEAARNPLLAGSGHASGASVSRSGERDAVGAVGLLLITGDRGLAGGFNSQVIRAGIRAGTELTEEGLNVAWYATGRRGVSSLTFRGREVSGSYTGFADKPSYADARAIAKEVVAAYTDGKVDRLEIVYNAYVSPLTQNVVRETLLPLSRATIAGEAEDDEAAAGPDGASAVAPGMAGDGSGRRGPGALVEYEPEAREILEQLVPDYVETSIYRALVESAAGFFGAQMTAMRNASENAGEIITDLTLEMNRARQAEITQEIMEVVAGAEGLS